MGAAEAPAAAEAAEADEAAEAAEAAAAPAGTSDWVKPTDGSNAADVYRQTLQALNKNMRMAIQIVVARPFIEHMMLSAVVAVAGRDTGATLFGPAGKSLHCALALVSTLPIRPCFHVLTCLCPLLSRLQTCRSRPTRRSRSLKGTLAFSNSRTRTSSIHFNTVALDPCHIHTLRAKRWLVYYGFSRTMRGADRCSYVAFCQRGGDASLHFLQMVL